MKFSLDYTQEHLNQLMRTYIWVPNVIFMKKKMMLMGPSVKVCLFKILKEVGLNLRDKRRASLFFLTLIWMSSCVPYKNVVLLQEIDEGSYQSNYIAEVYKVKRNDLLQIELKTFETNTQDFIIGSQTATFNNSQSGAGNPQLFFQGYSVDNQGMIDLPMLGKFEVLNKTTEQIGNELEVKLTEYKNFSKVTVTLSNFRINVLGEVKTPGVQYVYDNQYSLFQAIANAGDLTEFGSRKKVRLFRQTENGTKSIWFDLTQVESLNSEYFYLRPGDMIYVEPVKAKITRSNTQNVSLGVSLASFAITVFALLSK
jgi:polysaccharide biosynthesis/export protein